MYSFWETKPHDISKISVILGKKKKSIIGDNKGFRGPPAALLSIRFFLKGFAKVIFLGDFLPVLLSVIYYYIFGEHFAQSRTFAPLYFCTIRKL